jgi:uncharacterized protein YndB with AHSA1/START domain
MAKDRFAYLIFIRTNPETLWKALIEPDYTRRYWAGSVQQSEWKPGASWRLLAPDGKLTDSGSVLEIDPPRRLVLSWRNEFLPELRVEGHSRCCFEIERRGELAGLSVTHEMERADSKLIAAVSRGWPIILSSLKSLIETGQSFEETRHSASAP